MMTKTRQNEIKTAIKNFQMILWRESGQPQEANAILAAFEIIKAIEFLGYKVHESEIIPGGGIGYLNKPSKQVLIKSNLSQSRKIYTLAHELSHILLHKNMDVLHREEHYRYGQKRPKIEEEADYGASFFLMPEKLVRTEFKKRFLTSPLSFDSNVVDHLSKNPREKNELWNATKSSGIREMVLSKATTYNYKPFMSLADFFNVSNKAMAIHLQDLKLVTYP